jgi:hypothetical protein
MPEKFLRRYTTLPSLIYTLTEQRLTLLDPQSWDDKNDSYYLQLYREKKHLKSVLALCFTLGPETYHHWSVFADGPAGVCIQFDRKELVDALHARGGVRTGKVKYLLLTESRKRRLKVSELPFCKRYAYQHESEFRAIYESKRRTVGSLDIPFSLASISRITLSPWLPPALSNHVKETLWAIKGCAKLSIARSTLISNQEWQNLGERAK